MCGRFALTTGLPQIADTFAMVVTESAPPRYNIAPTQPIHVIFQEFGHRNLRLMRWGFVPSWVREPENFSLIINARCETAKEKPSFRSAIRHRRCLIPADGFYEWQRSGAKNAPYYFRPRDRGLIGYAGLYETYVAANGSEIDTVCFMTTAATADIAAIHHRMPVAIPPDAVDRWLDCAHHLPDSLENLYRNQPLGFYDIIPVSARVNSARNDGPELQEEVQAFGEAPRPKQGSKAEEASSRQLSLF